MARLMIAILIAAAMLFAASRLGARLRRRDATNESPITWLLVVVLVLALIATGCSITPSRAASVVNVVEVVAVDRTSIARVVTTWPAEAFRITTDELPLAHAAGVDEVDLIGIGQSLDDTALAARASLHPLCANPRQCQDELDSVFVRFARAAGTLAATPVETPGTGLFEALQTAKDLCGTRRCRILLITDGADSRLSTPRSADELLRRFAKLVPRLDNTVVRVVGLGAGMRNKALVERLRIFWLTALRRAGASDVQVARSL